MGAVRAARAVDDRAPRVKLEFMARMPMLLFAISP